MCFGGGGGGDGGAAAREADRQTNIDQAVEAVNRAFGLTRDAAGQENAAARSRQIEGVQSAVFDRLNREIQRQHEEAKRTRKFELARRGTIGGSADVDSGDELQRVLDEALIDARGRSNQVGLDLRESDEAARGSLLNRAQSGGDAGQLASDALARLALNQNLATQAGNAVTLGNIFGDTGTLFQRIDQQQGQQQGVRRFKDLKNTVGSTFFPSGGDKSRSGQVITIGG